MICTAVLHSHSRAVNRCSMSKIHELERMVDALRRQRNDCEPKSNQNPRYLRYSNAVSALLWLIEDLRAEETA
ncbi:hypothetical protein CBP52_16815 [Cellulomonas sp. PSBB021]|nr:hypothetical protein CBP52_16815 [Cellulomonas sp. PSBB021]